MDRRAFLEALALGILAAPIVAEGQQAGRRALVAILDPGAAASASGVAAFRERLRELGWIEGQNLAIESRHADFKTERLRGLAVELVGLKPDLIYTHSVAGVLAAKEATTTIPIVVGIIGDLMRASAVGSLARPGANITGMTALVPELDAKRLEVLNEVVPKTARVAFLFNASYPPSPELEEGARKLGVQLQRVAIRATVEIESAFNAIVKGRADALMVQDEPMVGGSGERIAALAIKHRLPTISQAPRFAERGGLLQYGADVIDLFRRSATHVDKILKGAKPADLPIEQPTKFELLINMKTAKALRLTIPSSLLARADRIIE